MVRTTHSKNYIGIDLGGTSIKGGRISEKGLEARRLAPVFSDGSQDEIFEDISAVIEGLWINDVAGIGFAVPALIDFPSGVMHGLSNIKQLNGFPIRQKLEERFDVPVLLQNDANCFVLGEKYFGVAKKYDSIIGLSTGTGVGGGIILDGKLYEGVNCGAGEFGMIPYKASNFESYCSGSFFSTAYGMPGEELSKLAEKENDTAMEAFISYGEHLGELIKVICYTFDPEAVIIGGSVSKSFKHYQRSMYKSLETYYFSSANRVSVLTTSGEDIALLGAASLFSMSRS